MFDLRCRLCSNLVMIWVRSVIRVKAVSTASRAPHCFADILRRSEDYAGRCCSRCVIKHPDTYKDSDVFDRVKRTHFDYVKTATTDDSGLVWAIVSFEPSIISKMLAVTSTPDRFWISPYPYPSGTTIRIIMVDCWVHAACLLQSSRRTRR
jgi:hypothetical protein